MNPSLSWEGSSLVWKGRGTLGLVRPGRYETTTQTTTVPSPNFETTSKRDGARSKKMNEKNSNQLLYHATYTNLRFT